MRILLKRQQIPLDRINKIHGTDYWNVEELLKSRRAKPPILVVTTKTGRYQLMDGHHRSRAAKLKGKKYISAWVLPPIFDTKELADEPLLMDDCIYVRWKGKLRAYIELRGY